MKLTREQQDRAIHGFHADLIGRMITLLSDIEETEAMVVSGPIVTDIGSFVYEEDCSFWVFLPGGSE
jgi:hypothetical protein